MRSPSGLHAPAETREAPLLAAVADLVRAGAAEPLAELLDRIAALAREVHRRREPGWQARLDRLRASCDLLSQSLTAEQRRVMQDIAEVQGRIQHRRKYAGTSPEAPAVDWRG